MVVVVVAGALLLVPPNLYMFGARSRLENGANTVVALVAAAREQAIMDGQPVQIELGLHKGEDGKVRHGHRLVFTNIPADRSVVQEGEDEAPRREEPEEREWLTTAWHDLPDGVEFAGVSERSGQWQGLRQERPYALVFGPDGSVEKGIALRIESRDLEEGGVKTENRTLTVVVNALSAEASVLEGLAEMPPSRDENEFAK